jgi:hypothetical protein
MTISVEDFAGIQGLRVAFNNYHGHDKISDVQRYGDWATQCRSSWPRQLLVPDLLSGSDYSGCLVNVANFQAFRKAFKATEGILWVSVLGGHGTQAIVIDMLANMSPDKSSEDETDNDPRQEIIDWLAALEDYPLADGDLHSKLEMESQDRAWDDWVRKDFWRALCDKAFNDSKRLYDLDIEPEYDAKLLFTLFCVMKDDSNTEWVNEQGDQSYIDIKRLTQKVDADQVLACLSLEGWKEIYAEQQSALKRCDEEIDASQEAFGLLVDALADKLGITSQELTRRIENVGCVEAIR